MRASGIPISALVAALLLAGCATKTPPKPVPVTDSAAETVRSHLDRALSKPEMPAYTKSADAKAPAPELTGALTVTWQGDSAVLLSRIAGARGLKFKVTGPTPRIPMFIYVDVKGASWEDFLTDVGAQFGQRADLVLADDTLEIRYRQ